MTLDKTPVLMELLGCLGCSGYDTSCAYFHPKDCPELGELMKRRELDMRTLYNNIDRRGYIALEKRE